MTSRRSATERITLAALLAFTTGCQSPEDRFTQDRSAMLCEHAYPVCDLTAGCVLDDAHYLSGSFPGTRRFLVELDEEGTELTLTLLARELIAPGSELLVRMYEPDCTVDTQDGQVHLQDVDLFEEVGDDRLIELQLIGSDSGEHMLELYSDASFSYLLTIDRW